MFEQSFAYFVGVLMALVTIYPSRALDPHRERRFLTVVIAVVILGFIGFPIGQGDSVGFAWELTALVALGAVTLGSLRSPWLLVAAWFGHGLWDLLFLIGYAPVHKPLWVTQLCVPYDWILAAYIVSRLPKWRAGAAA
jgi:hypothetical protein